MHGKNVKLPGSRVASPRRQGAAAVKGGHPMFGAALEVEYF